jgi:hypothetical protein
VAAREAQRLREANFEMRLQTAKLEELRQQNAQLKVGRAWWWRVEGLMCVQGGGHSVCLDRCC